MLRRGLSPLVTTISAPTAAPVIAGVRLRAGRAGSGRGAASMVTEAINLAKAAGATNILVRGDAAYGNSSVIRATLRGKACFSVVLTRTPPVNRAIDSIPETAWTPVQYPGAFTDPDTGELVSDAQVAEVTHTASEGTAQAVTARLIVRRVRDRNYGPEDEMFPVWRYHPFFTNNPEPAADADITHRRHAIIETLFADLIDGPVAHLPSGSFTANSAWAVLAAITHNLLRAAGALADKATARGATLRRHLINVPARFTRPQGRPTLRLPAHWPRADAWNKLWDNVFTNETAVQVAA